MRLCIDHADIDKIKQIYEYYPIDGVTTNPSILAASGRKPYEVLHEIREFIGADADLHVQVISPKAEDMVEEAHRIVKELGEKTYVKIPSVQEGFKAIRMLTAEGILTTGTAIYTPMQAYLAAKSGAKYVAPYINRIDNMGFDGVEVAKSIQDILWNNDLDCEILAASFKNSQQVLELCEYGVGAATAAPDIILGLVKNPAIEAAVDVFTKDFEKLVGEGNTMANC